MPNLLNFIRKQGTLLTNDHTVLISYTGGGILSTITGLYPDRHGQAVSNAYGFLPAGRLGGVLEQLQVLDGPDGRREPRERPANTSADPSPNMVNADPPSLGGTGAPRNDAGAVGPVHQGRM